MKYLCILLFYPFLLFAQSEIITDSRFAIEADLLYSKNNNFKGMGGNLGFSLFNLADIGFEYASGTYDPKYHMESSATAIFAAYNIKSKTNCFKLLAGYSQNTVDYYNEYFIVSGLVLGAMIYHEIYENESIILQPGIGLSAGFLSVSNGSRYNDYSKIENPKNAGLEFKIVPKINTRLYLVLCPSISKDLTNQENYIIIGLNIGLLFRIPNQ